MTTAFTADGYQDLRSYIQSNWPYIAVISDTGTELLRWHVSNNSNASYTSGPGSNPLTAELVITGQDLQDAGVSLPVTVSQTEAHKTSSSTSSMGTDTMTDATIEASADELTITHDYNLPQ